MLAKVYKLVTMFAVVSLLSMFVVAPITALPKSATKKPKTPPTPQPVVAIKPENATGPYPGWLVIPPQITHWYKFNYHYDNKGKNSEPTQAIVKLTRKSKACLSFEIWTTGGLQSGDSQKHKAVGVGSPMKGLGRVLIWSGGGAASETYYIAVKNTLDKACPYQLSISGPAVSY